MSKRFEIRDSEGGAINTIVAFDQTAADAIAGDNTAVLIDDGAARDLRLWRKKARAYRLAFRQALMMVPDSTGTTSLLAKLDGVAAAENDPYGTITLMLENVTIYERWRPEIQDLAVGLLVTVEGYTPAEADGLIDRLFAAAAALDNNDETRAAAILTGSEGFL